MTETAQRILSVATELFAERGFAGTSVRDICREAGCNVNAVSYHFGGKQPLYQSIIDRIGDDRFEAGRRILGTPPSDAADLFNRLLLFAEENMASHLADPAPLIILYAEMQQQFRNCEPGSLQGLSRQIEVLRSFLASARRRSLLRKGVDIEMVAGLLMERLHNQVHYVEFIDSTYGASIKDPKYRRHWTRQTIDLLLHGAARPPEE